MALDIALPFGLRMALGMAVDTAGHVADDLQHLDRIPDNINKIRIALTHLDMAADVWRSMTDEERLAVIGDGLNSTAALGLGGVGAVGSATRGARIVLTQADDAARASVVKAVGAACSFTPGTRVVVGGGAVPIASVTVGDAVIARDDQTFQTAEHEVTATWSHPDTELTTLVIEGESIETTPNHPFYARTESAVMLDLTVADVLTFFIGEGGWWVHNATPFCGVGGEVPKPRAPGESPPGAGWIWKGTGPEGSSAGSWTKPGTPEYVRWDPNEKTWGPHRDWRDVNGNGWRIFPDGSIRLK
jgi:hypothetical protein